jgi:predicted AAA+ superfamily ATPase
MRDIIRQKIVDSLASAPPALTRRDVRIPGVAGKAKAVIGPRRAGKTSFLWQMLAHKLERGVSREGLLYFNFEDERLADLEADRLHLVTDEYYRLHPEWRDLREAVLFFDEVQVVKGWEQFVRRLLDSERVDIFLSGSSARLLSREVATSMRGRAMEALVYPFSFREALRHQGREPDKPVDRLPKADRSMVDRALHDYLTQGGYPEAQAIETRDRFELLRSYVDTAMLRDVVERHGVSQPIALRWMVRHLLGNAGGTFSVHKFHADLRSQGIAVAKDTLHAFVAHVEDAFLVRTVSIAAESERRRMANPRKAYPIDPGLIPVFDRSGRANLGHALETAVALELDRRGAETAYVRSARGREVDFLARFVGGGQELIQVCSSLEDRATSERELRALAEAGKEYPRAQKCIVTLTPGSAPAVPDDVVVYDAAEWLLGEGVATAGKS